MKAHVSTISFSFLYCIVCALSACGDHPDHIELDRNKDGKADVWYELDTRGIYELVDRNFDGNVDESTLYDEDDQAVIGRIDENFDGLLESLVIYEAGYIAMVFVDVDYNGKIDHFAEFRYGVLRESSRFDHTTNTVQRSEFSFQFPVSKGLDETINTEDEFHERYCNTTCNENLMWVPQQPEVIN